MELVCKTKNYSKSYLKLLITGLFFLMIFLNVNPIVAKANEEGLYFDEDGNLYFITRDKKASGSVRYKTIGWIIKRYDMPIDAPEQQYVIVTKQNYKPAEPDPNNSKYIYCYFKSDKTEILNAVMSVSKEWHTILTGYGDDVYIDSVMTVVEDGEDKGTLYVGGSYEGEVYLTYEGISGARDWASPESLEAYFNMKIAFPQIVKKWESYAEIVDKEDVYFNTSQYSSFMLGAGSDRNQTFDVGKGIPSGESLFIKGRADRTQSILKLTYVHARLHECVEVPVTYILQWKDYYGVEQQDTRVVYRYYDVTRDFYYYEFGEMDVYTLSNIQVNSNIFDDDQTIDIPAISVADVTWSYVSYGQAKNHIADCSVNTADSIDAIVLKGSNGKKPVIPDANYSTIANTLVGNVYVRNDSVNVNGVTVLSDDVQMQQGSKPNVVLTSSDTDLYEDGIKITRSTLNGVYNDCHMELVYKNKSGKTLTYKDELNSVTIHTPVYCDIKAYSDKSVNQAVTPTIDDVVLGESMTITFNDFGMHRDIKGYGLGSYAKYVGMRQICCPFAVEYKGVRYEADTWINVDKYNIKLRVCEDNAEGIYTIYARTQAYNGLEDMVHKPIEENANMNIENYGAWDTTEVRIIGKLQNLQIQNGDNVYGPSQMPMEIIGEDRDSYELSFETVGDMSESDYVEIKYTYYHEDKDGILTPVDVYGVEGRNYIDGVIAGKFVDKEVLTYSVDINKENEEGSVDGSDDYNIHKLKWTTKHQLYNELLIVSKGTSIEEIKEAVVKDRMGDLCLRGGSIIVCTDITSYKDGVPHLSYINEENAKKGYCNMWLKEGGTAGYPWGAVLKIGLGDYTYYDYEISGTH